MSDLPAPRRDPTDEFLAAEFEAEAPASLRKSLLEQTTLLLHRRRRLRRAAFVTALAACYAAGILTMWLAFPRITASETVVIVQQVPDQHEESAPPAPPVMVKAEEDTNLSALDLEWKALDSPEKRPELFRNAGDRYLEESDIPSALRCYRSALEMGTQKDWNITTDDNWLMMALKEAKLKEKRHARDSG